jgi:hypothetical protein
MIYTQKPTHISEAASQPFSFFSAQKLGSQSFTWHDIDSFAPNSQSAVHMHHAYQRAMKQAVSTSLTELSDRIFAFDSLTSMQLTQKLEAQHAVMMSYGQLVQLTSAYARYMQINHILAESTSPVMEIGEARQVLRGLGVRFITSQNNLTGPEMHVAAARIKPAAKMFVEFHRNAAIMFDQPSLAERNHVGQVLSYFGSAKNFEGDEERNKISPRLRALAVWAAMADGSLSGQVNILQRNLVAVENPTFGGFFFHRLSPRHSNYFFDTTADQAFGLAGTKAEFSGDLASMLSHALVLPPPLSMAWLRALDALYTTVATHPRFSTSHGAKLPPAISAFSGQIEQWQTFKQEILPRGSELGEYFAYSTEETQKIPNRKILFPGPQLVAVGL